MAEKQIENLKEKIEDLIKRDKKLTAEKIKKIREKIEKR